MITPHREHCLGDQQARIGDNGGPEDLLEPVEVLRLQQLARHIFRRPVGHFDGISQRANCLVLQSIGAAVPEEHALRHHRRSGGGGENGLLRALYAGCLRSELREIHRDVRVALIGPMLNGA